MKKGFVIWLVTIMAVVFVGCSTSEVVTDHNQTQSDSEIKYAELIPDPAIIFVNGDISIIDADGGKAYIFQVKNYNDGEYEEYITECKNLGFTDISYESVNDGGKMFGAYTESGEYWVEVLQGNETGIIAVTCQLSNK